LATLATGMSALKKKIKWKASISLPSTTPIMPWVIQPRNWKPSMLKQWPNTTTTKITKKMFTTTATRPTISTHVTVMHTDAVGMQFVFLRDEHTRANATLGTKEMVRSVPMSTNVKRGKTNVLKTQSVSIPKDRSNVLAPKDTSAQKMVVSILTNVVVIHAMEMLSVLT
jgi:hypothetical protein